MHPHAATLARLTHCLHPVPGIAQVDLQVLRTRVKLPDINVQVLVSPASRRGGQRGSSGSELVPRKPTYPRMSTISRSWAEFPAPELDANRAEPGPRESEWELPGAAAWGSRCLSARGWADGAHCVSVIAAFCTKVCCAVEGPVPAIKTESRLELLSRNLTLDPKHFSYHRAAVKWLGSHPNRKPAHPSSESLVVAARRLPVCVARLNVDIDVNIDIHTATGTNFGALL